MLTTSALLNINNCIEVKETSNCAIHAINSIPVTYYHSPEWFKMFIHISVFIVFTIVVNFFNKRLAIFNLVQVYLDSFSGFYMSMLANDVAAILLSNWVAISHVLIYLFSFLSTISVSER